MPLFFALSGWFFLRSIQKRGVGSFVTGRLERILYPMVIWTYVFLAFKYLANQAANQPIGLEDVFVLPIPGVLHFWFLWALLLMSLAFYPLRYAPARATGAVLVLAGVAVVALQFLPLTPASDRWVGPAIRHAPYFLLGIALGHYGLGRLRQPGLGLLAAGIFVGLLYLWPEVAGAWYRLAVVLALVLSVLVAFLTFERHLPQGLRRLLAVLEVASMAIYVMHTIFSAALREGLLVAGVAQPGLHLVLGTFVGIIGPMIALWVFRRFGLTRILGLEARG